MIEESIQIKVAEEWEIVKTLLGNLPSTGNQINIFIFGPFSDLKQEIIELKNALRGEVRKKIVEEQKAPINKLGLTDAERAAMKKPRGVVAKTREEIITALKEAGGDRLKAATALGYQPDTIRIKIYSMKIKPEEYGK